MRHATDHQGVSISDRFGRYLSTRQVTRLDPEGHAVGKVWDRTIYDYSQGHIYNGIAT